MDAVECAPKCLLGWPIKTKTQIWFNWIVPIVLEQFVYVVLIVADVAVTYQHFIDGNHLWAGLTLTFIWLPAIFCFGTVITSPWNWPDYLSEPAEASDAPTSGEQEAAGISQQCLRFILVLAFNVLLFPLGALARFNRRLFWSIEALFHDKDSYERHHSLSKAAENSAFELYHFLQAFTQAAPQIVLQLYILLRDDIFRNYDTTLVQTISLIFSFLQMAIIAESYQRFESQKIVGRNYPWHPEELCQERKAALQRRTVPLSPSLQPRLTGGDGASTPNSVASPSITEFPDTKRGFNDTLPKERGENGLATSTGQLSTTGSDEDVVGRKTLHVDQNNFDVGKKSLHRKSSFMGLPVTVDTLVEANERGRADAGIYDIEIDGHAEPISGQEPNHTDDEKRALRADVDKIKLLQTSQIDGQRQKKAGGGDGDGQSYQPTNNGHKMGQPKVINVDPMTAMNVIEAEEQQLTDGWGRQRQRRNQQRLSYLAQDVADLYDDHDDGDDYNFDTSPTSPPPALPTSALSPFNKILNYPLNRLSTITDMLLLDTELYVKDHVPRLPEKIARHEFKSHHSMGKADLRPTTTTTTRMVINPQDDDAVKNDLDNTTAHLDIAAKQPSTTPFAVEIPDDDLRGLDECDGNILILPRRRKMVVGLEQEDFFAKTVAFLAWTFFILMRMLALSVFATLHWRETIYICLGHYAVVLGCLLYEVKLHARMQRLLFYFFLSYVYVFVIIEFKIKFIHLRMWYGLYVGLVLTQNFLLSVWWYMAVMDFELWWFDYLFKTILGSGALSLCCLLVYYLRLKPKDKVLFELMEETDQDRQ